MQIQSSMMPFTQGKIENAGSEEPNLNYQTFISACLSRRQQRNPRYSLRAFARDLGVRSSRLSEILNGRCGISKKRADKIAEHLELSGRERELFVHLVESVHGRSATKRKLARDRVRLLLHEAQSLGDAELGQISHWVNLALLEAIGFQELPHSIESLARFLGADPRTIELSLARLQRLGLIKKAGARWVATSAHRLTQSDVPSPAIRETHRGILNLALESIEQQSVEERDLSAFIFRIKRSDLPEIKTRIAEFRRGLARDFELLEGGDNLYCLSIQFFKLNK